MKYKFVLDRIAKWLSNEKVHFWWDYIDSYPLNYLVFRGNSYNKELSLTWFDGNRPDNYTGYDEGLKLIITDYVTNKTEDIVYIVDLSLLAAEMRKWL